jgi:hypothetical protein
MRPDVDLRNYKIHWVVETDKIPDLHNFYLSRARKKYRTFGVPVGILTPGSNRLQLRHSPGFSPGFP